LADQLRYSHVGGVGGDGEEEINLKIVLLCSI